VSPCAKPASLTPGTPAAKGERVARITISELLVPLVLIGCGAADPEPSASHVSSSQGMYVGEFRFDPNPPEVGQNQLTLQLAAAQDPVLGASIQLSPYMPAHGHSSSQIPTVSELGDGSYLASGIVYNMPGTWELTIDVSADVGSDSFVLSSDVR